MGDLLTNEEVAELTGLEQPAAQIKLLKKHGLNPIVRADGRPRLTWAALTAVIAGSKEQAWEPDFSSLRQGK